MVMRAILNLKPGTAVVRQYKNARKVCTFSAVNAGFATHLGYYHAKRGSNILFVDLFNIFVFGKLTEKNFNMMKNLKPEYKQIVARAKSISKSKKINTMG